MNKAVHFEQLLYFYRAAGVSNAPTSQRHQAFATRLPRKSNNGLKQMAQSLPQGLQIRSSIPLYIPPNHPHKNCLRIIPFSLAHKKLDRWYLTAYHYLTQLQHFFPPLIVLLKKGLSFQTSLFFIKDQSLLKTDQFFSTK